MEQAGRDGEKAVKLQKEEEKDKQSVGEDKGSEKKRGQESIKKCERQMKEKDTEDKNKIAGRQEKQSREAGCEQSRNKGLEPSRRRERREKKRQRRLDIATEKDLGRESERAYP